MCFYFTSNQGWVDAVICAAGRLAFLCLYYGAEQLLEEVSVGLPHELKRVSVGVWRLWIGVLVDGADWGGVFDESLWYGGGG